MKSSPSQAEFKPSPTELPGLLFGCLKQLTVGSEMQTDRVKNLTESLENWQSIGPNIPVIL